MSGPVPLKTACPSSKTCLFVSSPITVPTAGVPHQDPHRPTDEEGNCRGPSSPVVLPDSRKGRLGFGQSSADYRQAGGQDTTSGGLGPLPPHDGPRRRSPSIISAVLLLIGLPPAGSRNGRGVERWPGLNPPGGSSGNRQDPPGSFNLVSPTMCAFL